MYVNRNIQGVHEHNATGVASSKFGMSHDDVMELVEKCDVTKGLAVSGLHCHIGSTIEHVDMFRFVEKKNHTSVTLITQDSLILVQSTVYMIASVYERRQRHAERDDVTSCKNH